MKGNEARVIFFLHPVNQFKKVQESSVKTELAKLFLWVLVFLSVGFAFGVLTLGSSNSQRTKEAGENEHVPNGFLANDKESEEHVPYRGSPKLLLNGTDRQEILGKDSSFQGPSPY